MSSIKTAMLKRARTYRPGLFARLFSGENWKLTPGRRSTAGTCLVSGGGETELECLDLVSVQTAKGVLWHAWHRLERSPQFHLRAKLDAQ